MAMILPDDILGVIREMAKPRMRFIKEFNAASRHLGESEWHLLLASDVKKKLFTKEADQYITMFVEFVEAERLYRGATLSDLMEKVVHRDKLKRALYVSLYTETVVKAEEDSLDELYV
jgi:hypothetical protein